MEKGKFVQQLEQLNIHIEKKKNILNYTLYPTQNLNWSRSQTQI